MVPIEGQTRVWAAADGRKNARASESEPGIRPEALGEIPSVLLFFEGEAAVFWNRLVKYVSGPVFGTYCCNVP